jgi:hypothetical protein
MTQAAAVSTTNLAITVSDLEVRDGIARVEDLTLARALGFTSPHNIRALIRRYRSDLAVFGEVFFMCKKPTSAGGRPGETFYLNEEQAIFITAKSDTPKAAEITVEMVRVFRAYMKGQTPDDLTPVRAHTRRRPKPGFGTVIADTDRLYPFIAPGDELVLEFCTSATMDMTEPGAVFVLMNPCTRKPEPHWLARENQGVFRAPDPNVLMSRAVQGDNRDLVARHWPVLGRVIGVNKPTASERRAELARCA